jgi:hypothetical protein
MSHLPDGFHLIVKRDCPTCTLVEPVMAHLVASGLPLTIYSQDDPTFPALPDVIDDRDLGVSYQTGVEFVPAFIHIKNGIEIQRIYGWNREQWETLTGIPSLGKDLPAHRPGCGSKHLEPDMAEKLATRFGSDQLKARRVVLADLEDPIETAYDRGWSDGLPVVPPTEARVLRMLSGTTRPPDETVGHIPPNNAPCTVEKVAINAVMAGCKPEYMPVVLAAVEAACDDRFAMHGVLATTYFSGPVVIVNGPIVERIGMNAGINALGQGNRANATIGRALQLIIRNVGGGKPGGVDRSAMGNPGKYTFCFAEREQDSPWESYAQEQGFDASTSTVTLFAGEGVQGIMDQLSRTPESLAKSFALSLRSVCHTKIAQAVDAVLVVSPEHARVFAEAGWSKARLRQEIDEMLTESGDYWVRGSGGVAEGLDASLLAKFANIPLTKFRHNGLIILHVGGSAGLFSAIIGGWPGGATKGSLPVTKAIRE